VIKISVEKNSRLAVINASSFWCSESYHEVDKADGAKDECLVNEDSEVTRTQTMQVLMGHKKDFGYDYSDRTTKWVLNRKTTRFSLYCSRVSYCFIVNIEGIVERSRKIGHKHFLSWSSSDAGHDVDLDQVAEIVRGGGFWRQRNDTSWDFQDYFHLGLWETVKSSFHWRVHKKIKKSINVQKERWWAWEWMMYSIYKYENRIMKAINIFKGDK
jgi:hypothetical protein